MKKVAFPVRYFRSAFTPRAMFLGRKALKWWQMVIVFIFLSALSLIPVSLFYAQQRFNYDAFMPNANRLLARPELKQAARQFTFKAGQLQVSGQQVIYQRKHAVIGVNLTARQLKQVDHALNLKKTGFVLQERQTVFPARYAKDTGINPQTQITAFLKTSWFRSNRGALMVLMVTTVGLIVLGANLLLILGAAFILSLMRRNSQTSIHSFKEALNMTLNASLYGAILAAIVGCIRFDFSLMSTLFSAALVINILLIYWRTRFSDQFIKQLKESEA